MSDSEDDDDMLDEFGLAGATQKQGDAPGEVPSILGGNALGRGIAWNTALMSMDVTVEIKASPAGYFKPKTHVGGPRRSGQATLDQRLNSGERFILSLRRGNPAARLSQFQPTVHAQIDHRREKKNAEKTVPRSVAPSPRRRKTERAR